MVLQKPRGYPRNLWPDDAEIRRTVGRWEYNPKVQAFNRKVRRETQKACRKAAEAMLMEML